MNLFILPRIWYVGLYMYICGAIFLDTGWSVGCWYRTSGAARLVSPGTLWTDWWPCWRLCTPLWRRGSSWAMLPISSLKWPPKVPTIKEKCLNLLLRIANFRSMSFRSHFPIDDERIEIEVCKHTLFCNFSEF